MALFNNHVHASMTQAVRANEFSLANKSLSMRGFGLFPKFELTPIYDIVLHFEPKSGLFPLIFSKIRPKQPLLSLSLEKESVSAWISLYPWYLKLSHKARGLYIQKQRFDTITISHTLCEGGMNRRFKYLVNIRARVDTKTFFTFLLTNADSGDIILKTLQNKISEEIERILCEQAGNPSFIRHIMVEDAILEKSGYQVEDCRIQYVATDNETNN